MEYPIMEFKTQEELNKCLQEWKQRLFLSDWNIKASLAHGEEIQGLAGNSNIQWVNSCGTIQLRYADEMPAGMIEKAPHEKVLVHELLHFKYMAFDNNSLEAAYFDEKQRQLLEQMAKSLIMAKYGIEYNWFRE